MLNPLSTWDLGQTWATFTKGTFHGVIMGVEVQKSDDDLLRYEAIVEETQPELVIETGTRAGGSALYFNQQLNLEVISIDRSPEFRRGQPPLVSSSMTWIRGSSIDQDIKERVRAMVEGKRVMVSLDADHHSAHVQDEIRMWSQFVSPGCALVVEDACFDMFDRFGQPDWARVGGARIPEEGGPLDAMDKVGLEFDPRFYRDELVEAMTPISHSPCGWWRRHG